VIPVVVVVGHEVLQSRLQLLGELVVLELDDILHRPVIALDLALGLRVIRSASGMRHLPVSTVGSGLAMAQRSRETPLIEMQVWESWWAGDPRSPATPHTETGAMVYSPMTDPQCLAIRPI
jgi:hypothetical protein